MKTQTISVRIPKPIEEMVKALVERYYITRVAPVVDNVNELAGRSRAIVGRGRKANYTSTPCKIPTELKPAVNQLIDQFHLNNAEALTHKQQTDKTVDRKIPVSILAEVDALIDRYYNPVPINPPPIPRQKSTSTKWPGGSGDGWAVIEGEFQFNGVVRSDREWCKHFGVSISYISKCKKLRTSPYDAFIRQIGC